MAMPRKTIGLTLLTLVIVFILFAITWVEYSRAKIRSNIAKAKNGLNITATVIESYAIDWNSYPKPDLDTEGYPIPPRHRLEPHKEPPRVFIVPREQAYAMKTSNRSGDSNYSRRTTWGVMYYIKELPDDPFNPKEKSLYHYVNVIYGSDSTKLYYWSDSPFLISSYGPDQVCGYGTTKFDIQHFVVDPVIYNDSAIKGVYYKCIAPFPLQSSPFTYDPTNGLISGGDIWQRGG